MEKINVLLLGAAKRVSFCEWLIEAGKKYNREVKIFSIENQDPVPVSKYAKVIIGPVWEDPSFPDLLLRTINDHKINIVIPLMDAACSILSREKPILESRSIHNTWCCVSSYELCNTFNDKGWSECWFLQNNVNIPYTLFENIFPKICKKINGYGSNGQFIVTNNEDYLKARRTGKYFIQPYIEPEEEYTIDAFVSKDGSVVGAVSRVRLETTGGEATRTITKRNEEILTEARRILGLPGFQGPVTLQVIRGKKDGKYYWLEINARSGGGAPCSWKAGANYMECIIANYLNEPLPDCSVWKEGLLMMRANREFWALDGKLLTEENEE